MRPSSGGSPIRCRRWRLLRPCLRAGPCDVGCAPASALTAAEASPVVAPPRVLGCFAGKGSRFRHGSWTSVRFLAGVVRCQFLRPGETPTLGGVSGRFALRNRPEVCRWGLLGLKVAHLDMCSGPVGAGRKHCDCRAVCVDAPSASRGMEGCSGNERSFFARLLRTALRDALISRAISATESPCFLSQRMEYADDMLTIFLPPWSNTCQQ